MKDLVLSRQDFASFRKKNRLYVDKTEYAYRLAKEKEGFLLHLKAPQIR